MVLQAAAWTNLRSGPTAAVGSGCVSSGFVFARRCTQQLGGLDAQGIGEQEDAHEAERAPSSLHLVHGVAVGADSLGQFGLAEAKRYATGTSRVAQGGAVRAHLGRAVHRSSSLSPALVSWMAYSAASASASAISSSVRSPWASLQICDQSLNTWA